jgi:hypothetical protein
VSRVEQKTVDEDEDEDENENEDENEDGDEATPDLRPKPVLTAQRF